MKYRWHWTFPIAISPHDHNRVYVGSQVVHETTNGGQSWRVISPDLTTNNKEHQLDSGGITTDNLMTFDGALLFAIAESPLEKGLIWAGTNDGQLQITRDGGANWSNVTANLKALPAWGTVSGIEPSRFDAATTYVAMNLQQVGDFNPYIYKTADYGKTWKLVSAGIPKSISSFVHVVREDPVRKGMLYAGTDNAVYFSLDDGEHWNKVQNNLPPAPAYWLAVQENFNDLVIGTYGRGFWILDDVTPLRGLGPEVLAADAHLFAPRAAYRFQNVEGPHSEGSHVTGQNPPYGADINYYVKGAPKGEVQIQIVDSAGKTLRTLTHRGKPGINRVWWDLRYERSRQAKLRTPPPGKPWVKVGPEGYRTLVTWGGGPIAPLAPPGTYTVKLTVDGREKTESLTLRKDPNTSGTEQDIKAQVALALQLRDEVNDVVDMIEQIEWTRKQLLDLALMLEGQKDVGPVLEAAKDLEKKALAVEGKLFDVKLTGKSEDSFRAPMQIYGKLMNLGGNVVGSGVDFPPTDQQVEVHKLYQQQLSQYKIEFKELMETHVPAFKATLKSKSLPTLITSGVQ